MLRIFYATEKLIIEPLEHIVYTICWTEHGKKHQKLYQGPTVPTESEIDIEAYELG